MQQSGDDKNILTGSSASAAGAGIDPDLEHLRSYAEIRLALGDLFRTVRQALVTLDRQEADRQFGELMSKLAEDRFTLAVLGQFKRGKSSLMNAIIGREILPTGVLPLTSVITILRFGPKERLIIQKENGLYPAEFPVAELAAYVTEKGNPGNRKGIKAAYLELPVPFLRYGMEFVDTPGVGSSILANTETTYRFLPECDAALFVSSVDTPMTSEELRFLEEIKEHISRIFFVINKTDLVTDEERHEVEQYVAAAAGTGPDTGTAKVFSVSARLALEAKASGRPDLYERSGLKALEDSLASFLTKEKSGTFLSAIAQKGLRMLDQEIGRDILSTAYLQARTSAIAAEKVKAMPGDPREAASAIAKARARLDAFCQAITHHDRAEGIAGSLLEPLSSGEGEAAISAIDLTRARTVRPAAAIDLQAGLQTRGCPVCEHIAGQAFDFFAHWQYQLTVNERAREEFAAGLGFCPLHTWQLLAISSPQGASIGYAQLAKEAGRRLKATPFSPASGSVIRPWIHNAGNCPACRFLRREEENYTARLIASLDDEAGKSRYLRSEGACLYHLSRLLDATASAGTGDLLLQHARERFEQDAEDMRTYALKSDALRRALQNENEKDAYRRTVIRIVGGRSVCMPWAQDAEI
jgi:GTP-binding protein EngB required for normal cell division